MTRDPKELNLVAEGDEQSANIMKRAGDTLGSERKDLRYKKLLTVDKEIKYCKNYSNKH